MNIEDAFTQEAIANAETDVGGSEETELRDVIRRVCGVNEVELSDDEVSIVILAFVAGRTYQLDKGFPVTMTIPMLRSFMQFLAREGEA